ncbi:MAG TPA: 3-dehydroquinate synthase, partial [Coleofasciculaceae cyanobacterium]
MKSVIRVDVPQQSYDIAIAKQDEQASGVAGGLDDLGVWMSRLKLGKKVLVVSNPAIFKKYGERAIAALNLVGYEISTCILPAGERYKTLKSVQKIYDVALEQRLERSSTIVALGGGVVGDMAGFAAATWLRGINVV